MACRSVRNLTSNLSSPLTSPTLLPLIHRDSASQQIHDKLSSIYRSAHISQTLSYLWHLDLFLPRTQFIPFTLMVPILAQIASQSILVAQDLLLHHLQFCFHNDYNSASPAHIGLLPTKPKSWHSSFY